MRPARALLLGLVGILLAAAFAMGALALVRGGLDEPSDVGDFPALVPSTTGSSVSVTPSPSAVGSPQDDDQVAESTSTSPTPTRTDGAGSDPTDGDGDREGPRDDD